MHEPTLDMPSRPNSGSGPAKPSAETGKTGAGSVLVAFAPFALWSPHFETDLELVKNHVDAGGSAIVLSCNGQLLTCEPNPEHRRLACLTCQSRFRSGMRWLKDPAILHETFYELTEDEALQVEQLRQRKWRDLEEVRNFRLNGADVGLAAVSSLVSWCREPSPDVTVFAREIGAHVASAAMVYFSIARKLPRLNADLMTLFNGRLAALRPALRAAQQLAVTTYVHERAGYRERYGLTMDTYPHDLAPIKREIEELYSRAELSTKERDQALDWYRERRDGIAQGWVSFVGGQRRDELPVGIGEAPVDVAIFVSSEDEFVAIEEWNNPFYRNQNDAILQLLSDFEDEPRLRFFLRLHPNMAGLENSQLLGVQALAARFPNLVVIGASSRVSSYALIDAVDLVISYGSTIGIEAAFAGKPSVLMGRAMYEDLGACLRPESHQALVSLLADLVVGRRPELPAGLDEGLVKFGHYNRVGGRAYSHLVPHGLFDARMREEEGLTAIKAGRLLRTAFKLSRFAHSLRRRFSP
ncbi:MAG: hypothetical protein A3E01_08930 [Gammaproteobacteria bacterium RIFCSPHIGHO2_12_FULL_63_22]|nr:MAG: hypothetical protein A3E01_08930 [Gammaproteobacteria bacterium RIFCSPHIGHO2_12_FULL_63_22]